jgi:hypothetical protein
MNSFLSISTPADMFAKLQREYARYAADPQCEHSDYIINTTITAYHLLEYVRKMVPKLQVATEALGKNDLMTACQDLANKSKHLTLTSQHRTASDPETEYVDGTIGGSALNAIALNGGDFWLLTYDDGRQYEIDTVLSGVVALWTAFFKTHF